MEGFISFGKGSNTKGLLSVLSGQLRVYIVSEEGREVTLFRVYGGEVCVGCGKCRAICPAGSIVLLERESLYE